LHFSIQLLAEREEKVKEINNLVLNDKGTQNSAPSDDDFKRTDLYATLRSQIATNERKVFELQTALEHTKSQCAQAMADADAARIAMEDLQIKHSKKWSDMVDPNAEVSVGPEEELPIIHPSKQAEDIITLQHKLAQALENVRQAESTRAALADAVSVNESLQARLEEFEAKENGNSSDKEDATEKDSAEFISSNSKVKPSDIDPEKLLSKFERLHMEYKKLKQKMSELKEYSKRKAEKLENERKKVEQANSRLLKQSAEKEDMNAKSLSTILHLKQVTQQLTKERKNLEQQAKSANQLALAARLAANARERLSEEFTKERQELEKHVKELEEKYDALAQEKEVLEGKVSQHDAKMESLMEDVNKAKSRCEILASESTKLQEEKQKMSESLAVAQRDATEASKAAEDIAKRTGTAGMVSEFTAEQLTTQVSVLKSRLACPVCNVRDKSCILLRCRHMFCKSCIDENIKNRSRKCPACGGRFDTKDVSDVWL
jgi:E3 ubiquitin-protein ligase BRE1